MTDERRAHPGRRATDRLEDEVSTSDGEISKTKILEALDVTRRSVDALAGQIEGLASKEELEDVKTTQDRRTRRLALAVGIAVLLLLGAVGILTEIRDVAEGNRQTAETQAKILEELVECTTPAEPGGPPHECYDRGQAGQAAAVAAIVTAILDGIDQRIEAILLSVGIEAPPSTTTTAPGSS